MASEIAQIFVNISDIVIYNILNKSYSIHWK